MRSCRADGHYDASGGNLIFPAWNSHAAKSMKSMTDRPFQAAVALVNAPVWTLEFVAPTENSNSDVVMMKTTEYGQRGDVAA